MEGAGGGSFEGRGVGIIALVFLGASRNRRSAVGSDSEPNFADVEESYPCMLGVEGNGFDVLGIENG